MKILIAAMLAAGLCGCSALYVHDGSDDGPQPETSQTEALANRHVVWHHNFAFGLYEGPALDVVRVCDGHDWSMIALQPGVLPVVLGAGVVALMGAGGLSAGIWQPQRQEVWCQS
jgi:uncharacterized protein YceK